MRWYRKLMKALWKWEIEQIDKTIEQAKIDRQKARERLARYEEIALSAQFFDIESLKRDK